MNKDREKHVLQGAPGKKCKRGRKIPEDFKRSPVKKRNTEKEQLANTVFGDRI